MIGKDRLHINPLLAKNNCCHMKVNNNSCPLNISIYDYVWIKQHIIYNNTKLGFRYHMLTQVIKTLFVY